MNPSLNFIKQIDFSPLAPLIVDLPSHGHSLLSVGTWASEAPMSRNVTKGMSNPKFHSHQIFKNVSTLLSLLAHKNHIKEAKVFLPRGSVGRYNTCFRQWEEVCILF